MKKINVVCFDRGIATVTTADINIDNEHKATTLEIDFSNTSYPEHIKWVDLILSNGTSLRYELGETPVVTLELTYELTIKGEMIITPFLYDGLRKIKYKTDSTIIIHEQKEAGTSNVVFRDDYIFQLEQRVQALELKVAAIEEALNLGDKR